MNRHDIQTAQAHNRRKENYTALLDNLISAFTQGTYYFSAIKKCYLEHPRQDKFDESIIIISVDNI